MRKGVVFLISIFLLTQTLYGCWIYRSPDVRVEGADLIAIVELVGEKGKIDKEERFTGRANTERFMRQDTVWEVKIHQIIKGEQLDGSIDVLTAGARDAKGTACTDFYLDDYFTEYALLFLNEKEQGYYVNEPVDVVPLKSISRGTLAEILEEKNLLRAMPMEEEDKEDWLIYSKLLLELEEQKQKEALDLLNRIGEWIVTLLNKEK